MEVDKEAVAGPLRQGRIRQGASRVLPLSVSIVRHHPATTCRDIGFGRDWLFAHFIGSDMRVIGREGEGSRLSVIQPHVDA